MKKVIKTLFMSMLILSMVTMPTMAAGHPYSFNISNKTLNIEKGDRFTLIVSGSAALLGRTTWNSSDKEILQIESVESGNYLNKNYKANVVAVGTGKASIIAKNTKNSDALSCSVTVGNAEESQQEKPVITNAVSTGTSKAGKIKLEWSGVDGAEKYILQISKNKNFEKLYRDAETKNTYYNTGWSYYRLSGSVELYYCRVKAVVDGVEGEWSDTVICEQK